MTSEHIQTAQPYWITKMYAGKVGRDHLGLGSVASDQILPTLSPAINVLTQRPRYYSFYAFLLDEFLRRERPATPDAWVAFYRPREFIFSIGDHLPAHAAAHPEHARGRYAVGTNATAGLAGRDLPVYHTLTKYIESPLGGYGLYYRTVMAELELIYLGGTGYLYPIDVISEKGRLVAAAFREAVRDTVYYRDYFDHDEANVPGEVIAEYIDRACLCQLQHPAAPDRPLLLERFLHGGAAGDAVRRCLTFRLFLDLARQSDGRAVDDDTFRQLIYFGAAENGARFTPIPELAETGRRWRHYQAHEYYSFALNGLWNHLCDWGLRRQGDVRPLPLDELWRYIEEEALDFDGLARRMDLPPPGLGAGSGFRQLTQWMESLVGATGSDFDAACGLAAPVNEHRLYRLANRQRGAVDVMVAGMIALLALLYLRFGRPEVWQQPEWELAEMGQNGRLPLAGYVRALQRRLASSVTVFEVARWLVSDYVIQQHLTIATGKLPENTFRFQRQGGRLQFYPLENTLRFMDSRFNALSTIVNELGLCGNLSRPNHPLTADGELLLEVGEL